MNDLTKEARDRAIAYEKHQSYLEGLGAATAYRGNALANANAGPKYGDKHLNPDRPLTGEPEHYQTGLEGSRCEVIKRYAPMTFKWQETGLDINDFRKFCEEIGE